MDKKTLTYQKLPNILTYIRILLIPGIVVLIYLPYQFSDLIAATLFMAACFTDYLDGYFARVLKQTSALGRFLDPVADKLLVSAVLLLLVELGRIHGLAIIPAIIILCREILVSGLREFLAEINKVSIPVSRLAKWKTALQMLALGILLINPTHLPWFPAREFGIGALWVAGLLTLVTGYEYLKASIHHLAAE